MIKHEKLFYVLFLSGVVVLYIGSGAYGMFLRIPGHDETMNLLHSWSVLSGQASWYTLETPLFYMPMTYLLPGIFQLVFGQGIIEARLPGFLAGLATLGLTFTYFYRLCGFREGCLAAGLILLASGGFAGWATISVHAVSDLLLVAAFITSSPRFINHSNIRLLLTALLLVALLFTRINHLMTVALFLPVFYFNAPSAPLKKTIMLASLILALAVVVLLLLPPLFLIQIGSLGIGPFIAEHFPVLGQTSSQLSNHPDIGDLFETTRRLTWSGIMALPPLPDSSDHSFWSLLVALSPKLFYVLNNLWNNFDRVTLLFGVIFFGIIALFGIAIKRRKIDIYVWSGFAFVFVFIISFIVGYELSVPSGIDYTQYHAVFGVMAATVGLAQIGKKENIKRVVAIAATCVVGFFLVKDSYFLNPLNPTFSREYKSELARIAVEIQREVPAEKNVLVMGPLPWQPILLTTYLANRGIYSPLALPMFTFYPVPLSEKLTDEQYLELSKVGLWTPHHLTKWIEEYEYVVKPTYLYYDDHENKYWSRGLFYPKEARYRIAELFACRQLPRSHGSIPPLDICTRKNLSIAQ